MCKRLVPQFPGHVTLGTSSGPELRLWAFLTDNIKWNSLVPWYVLTYQQQSENEDTTLLFPGNISFQQNETPETIKYNWTNISLHLELILI